MQYYRMDKLVAAVGTDKLFIILGETTKVASVENNAMQVAVLTNHSPEITQQDFETELPKEDNWDNAIFKAMYFGALEVEALHKLNTAVDNTPEPVMNVIADIAQGN